MQLSSFFYGVDFTQIARLVLELLYFVTTRAKLSVVILQSNHSNLVFRDIAAATSFNEAEWRAKETLVGRKLTRPLITTSNAFMALPEYWE